MPGGSSIQQMTRIQECPGPISSAAHLLQEGVKNKLQRVRQQLPAEARAQLYQLKTRLQSDIQRLQHKRQQPIEQIIITCSPAPSTLSPASSTSSGAAAGSRGPAAATAAEEAFRPAACVGTSDGSNTSDFRSHRLGSSNFSNIDSSSSLGSLIQGFSSMSINRGCSGVQASEEKQETCGRKADQAAPEVTTAAQLVQQSTASALKAHKASLAADSDWVSPVSAQGGSIPVAHNISLSPRDTDTSCSSVMSPGSPVTAHLLAHTAAAAHAAAERVKTLTAPLVPDCVLVAAEARAAVKAAKRAVRRMRTFSAPEVLALSAAAAAAVVAETPATAVVVAAAVSPSAYTATARPTAANILTLSSCGGAAPAAWLTAAPAVRRTGNEDDGHKSGYTHVHAMRKRSKSMGAAANVDEDSWASVYCLSPSQNAAATAINQQLQQQVVRSASQCGSSSAGNIASHNRAPSMTAAAAAVYSTVAADVEVAMRQESGVRSIQLPQCTSTKDNDVSKALARQRLHTWLDGVVQEMHTTGVLPPHRVYLWVRRPVKPKPTRLQRLQQKLVAPWNWLQDCVVSERRRKRAAIKRAALLAPVT